MGAWRGVFHWDPVQGRIVEGHAPERPPDLPRVTKRGDEGGISFQLPPGWTDGSGKVKYVKDGIYKGRVRWDSRQEAKELAKRVQDHERAYTKYDPS